jgi:hypothetical protein
MKRHLSILILIIITGFIGSCASTKTGNHSINATCPAPLSPTQIDFSNANTVPPYNYNLLKDNSGCYGLTGVIAVKSFQGTYGPWKPGYTAVFPGERAKNGKPVCANPTWKGDKPIIVGTYLPPIEYTKRKTNHQKLIDIIGGSADDFVGFSVLWTENGPVAGLNSCTCNKQWFNSCTAGVCDGFDWGHFIRTHVVPRVAGTTGPAPQIPAEEDEQELVN